MTALAIGASASVTLGDGGSVVVATNGGFANITYTPTGGATVAVSIGPHPVRRVFGPFTEGAAVALANVSAGEFDYGASGGGSAAITTIAASGAALTITPPASGNAAYLITLDANCVFYIAAGTAGVETTLTIELRNAGGFTPSFPNVEWPSDTAPAFNTLIGKADLIQLRVNGASRCGVAAIMGRTLQTEALPSAPQSVTATGVSGGVLVDASPLVSWPLRSGYNLYRKTVAGVTTADLVESGISLPYSNTGLVNGTTYYYKLAAVNFLGVGTLSAEVSAVPIALNYALFSGGLNNFLYVPHKTQFAPGTASFEFEIGCRATVSNVSQTLISKWQGGFTDRQCWWFYLDAAGKMALNWRTSTANPTFFATATATVVDGIAAGNTAASDCVRKVICDPVTGATTFWISTDQGANFTQVGGTAVLSGSAPTAEGAVDGTALRDVMFGQDSAAVFKLTGRIYSGKMRVGGTLVINGTASSTAFVDVAIPGGTANTWTAGAGVSFL